MEIKLMNSLAEIATLDKSMVECPQMSEGEKESLLAVMRGIGLKLNHNVFLNSLNAIGLP